MGTIRKRKLKIKKKNFTIFLICLILITLGIVKGVNQIIKIVQSPKEIKEEKKTNNSTDNNKVKDERLNKLNNVDKKIDYFNYDYVDRYISYKEKNKDLDDIQIVKDVNMNVDKNQYENPTEATKLNENIILVNKFHYLKKDYIPKNLEEINKNYALSGMKLVNYAKEAFEELAKDAKKEKLNIVAMSTYRSYDYQVDLYNRYVKSDGKEAADTYSGRPGHSEHQTGLAVDVFNNDETYTNFEKTKEFEWMQEHAHEYGFILRFPKDKEKETGYQYESWHYRYVGKDIAKYIKNKNISLEEYYVTKIKD